MTHLSVRQYVDAHGIEADTDDCLHLSQGAKRYSALHHLEVGRRPPGRANCFWLNTYDERALEAVCKNFKHSDSEHLCIWCLKSKPNKYFYLKGNDNLFSHCKNCHAQERARRAGTLTKADYLRLKAQNHPHFAERFAKLMGK